MKYKTTRKQESHLTTKEPSSEYTRKKEIPTFFGDPILKGYFKEAFEKFMRFLTDLKKYQIAASNRKSNKAYVESKEINKIIYTVQQATGCMGDSFENPNQ